MAVSTACGAAKTTKSGPQLATVLVRRTVVRWLLQPDKPAFLASRSPEPDSHTPPSAHEYPAIRVI